MGEYGSGAAHGTYGEGQRKALDSRSENPRASRGRGTGAEGRAPVHRCASIGRGLPRSAEWLDGRIGGGPYLVPCPGRGSSQRFPSGGGRRGTDRYRESLFQITKESGALVEDAIGVHPG